MPTLENKNVAAESAGEDMDVVRLGGRERIANNLFSAIRSAACTTVSRPDEGLSFLPERTAGVLREIVRGTVGPKSATAEDIFDLLTAFQISVETALPVWPPLGSSECKVGVLAGGSQAVTRVPSSEDSTHGSELPSPDEVFVRIHAIKATFDGNS